MKNTIEINNAILNMENEKDYMKKPGKSKILVLNAN